MGLTCWFKGHKKLPLTYPLLSVFEVGSVEICDRCGDLYFEGKDKFPIRYIFHSRPDLDISDGRIERLVEE
jgi:hypothetical protein